MIRMSRRRKRSPLQIAILLVLSLVAYGAKNWFGDKNPSATGDNVAVQSDRSSDAATQNIETQNIESVIRQSLSGEVVESDATVTKTLPDDNDGSRHQRFIVRLASGKTLLIAHNIDIAKRVPLEEGTRFVFADSLKPTSVAALSIGRIAT